MWNRPPRLLFSAKQRLTTQRPLKVFRAVTARNRTGGGLGLAIAQWIVGLHNGSIRVESEPGEGTRFTVTLPCRI